MSKSLISSLPNISTSYTYEIKELREKVLYWKRASEIHHLEGFHILAELYAKYMKQAQEELKELLEVEKKEQNKSKEPKHYFVKEVICSYYKPVLPALEKETEETENFINEDKTLSYESIFNFETARIS